MMYQNSAVGIQCKINYSCYCNSLFIMMIFFWICI